MTRFAAGRNTVREAVQGLVALGMLEVKAGYGTTVSRADGRVAIARSVADRPLDQAALVDLVEFRVLLEGEAASLAAQRATPEDLALIREKLAVYQNTVRRSEEIYAHDVEFHRAISSAAHNGFYLEVIDTSSSSSWARNGQPIGRQATCSKPPRARADRSSRAARQRRRGGQCHARAHPGRQRTTADGDL